MRYLLWLLDSSILANVCSTARDLSVTLSCYWAEGRSILCLKLWHQLITYFGVTSNQNQNGIICHGRSVLGCRWRCLGWRQGCGLWGRSTVTPLDIRVSILWLTLPPINYFTLVSLVCTDSNYVGTSRTARGRTQDCYHTSNISRQYHTIIPLSRITSWILDPILFFNVCFNQIMYIQFLVLGLLIQIHRGHEREGEG